VVDQLLALYILSKGLKMKNDPKEFTARFNSSCAETGKAINKGDTCIYYPSEKKVYHMESKQAQEFRSWSFDINYLGCEY
jgi:hypothetical protein